jgi:hypothetical protein
MRLDLDPDVRPPRSTRLLASLLHECGGVVFSVCRSDAPFLSIVRWRHTVEVVNLTHVVIVATEFADEVG